MNRYGGVVSSAQQAGQHRGIEVAGHVFYVQTTLSLTGSPTVVSELFHSGRVLRVFRTPFAAEEPHDPREVQEAIAESQARTEQFVWERFSQLEPRGDEAEESVAPPSGQTTRKVLGHLARTEELAAQFGQWRHRDSHAGVVGNLHAMPDLAAAEPSRVDEELSPVLPEAAQVEVAELYANLHEIPLGSLQDQTLDELDELISRVAEVRKRIRDLTGARDEADRLDRLGDRDGDSNGLDTTRDALRSAGTVIQYVKKTIRDLEHLIVDRVVDEETVRAIRERMRDQLYGALVLRRAFADFRLAISRSERSDDLGVRLRYAATDLATLLGSSAHRWLRMGDRTLLLDLQYRLREVIVAGDTEGAARELWADIESTVTILFGINQRDELLRRDRSIVAALPSELPDRQTVGFHAALRQLYGLRASLDEAIVTGADLSESEYSQLLMTFPDEPST